MRMFYHIWDRNVQLCYSHLVNNPLQSPHSPHSPLESAHTHIAYRLQVNVSVAKPPVLYRQLRPQLMVNIIQIVCIDCVMVICNEIQ